jgi:UrcA family protein
MLRTLSLAALAAALALPAAAETTVKVDVTGLDAPATHARIVKAAKAACRVELRNSTSFDQYIQWNGCINDAVAHAEADLKSQQASAGGRPVLAGR